MTEQGHNGWTNYETWVVHLWLTNEEPSYRYWSAAARDALAAAWPGDGLTAPERARLLLAERLQSELEKSAPDLGASMYADILGAALDQVNWYEIAEALLEAR